MGRSLLILLSFVLLTSCRPEPAILSDSPAVPPDLNSILRDAAAGSPSELFKLGTQIGGGAWFALAAAAEAGEHSELVQDLRIRSAENDPEPFRTLSLVSLLTADPAAIPRPLRALKKAEKRVGLDEGLRMARIAVLQAAGDDRALAAELELFRGEPWEVSVLAAAIGRGDNSPETIAIAERFILHCSDPSALRFLPDDPSGPFSFETRRLLEARLAFSRGDETGALNAYRDWLELRNTSEESCELESAPPVYGEMADAARLTGVVEEWADLLGDSKDAAAALQSGGLYRELKAYREASSAYLKAADSAPRGLDRDRAIWLRLRVMYEDYGLTLEEELEAVSWAVSSWDDADRFADRLSEFLHRRVRRGEWPVLEQFYRDQGPKWPDSIRSRAAWILAFATVEGRLKGNGSVAEYLETAAESAPLSWSGLRAAGLLNRGLPRALAESVPPPSPLTEPGTDDLIIALYLKWGLHRLSADLVLDEPDRYSNQTVRMAASALAEGQPRVSIRIAGLLWGRDDFTPTREDLLLRYPLPYGNMAAGIAELRGVPPDIFHGLIRTESAWDAVAVSRSGAQGLAQFMPATWDEWVRRLRYPQDADPMDPEINLTFGAAYLEWLNLREWTFGWTDVLASYNAGGGRIRTWRNERPGLGDDLFGMSIPIEEPRSYIRKVLSAGTIYGYLYADESPRSLHEEWGFEMFEVK